MSWLVHVFSLPFAKRDEANLGATVKLRALQKGHVLLTLAVLADRDPMRGRSEGRRFHKGGGMRDEKEAVKGHPNRKVARNLGIAAVCAVLLALLLPMDCSKEYREPAEIEPSSLRP